MYLQKSHYIQNIISTFIFDKIYHSCFRQSRIQAKLHLENASSIHLKDLQLYLKLYSIKISY